MKTVEAFAPAKVNLTLHVTGQRSDGYHLLDSLVVFADVADKVTATLSDDLSLVVRGPRAEGVPTDRSNLVLKAAALMQGPGAALELTKILPAASGIGGGSADAAATLRALSQLWSVPLPPADEILRLGADVPVCVAGTPVRLSGIGETLEQVPAMPPLPAVLVNPGVEVATPAVFQALESRQNAPMPDIPQLGSVTDTARWLSTQRNDLEAPACAIVPEIPAVLRELRTQTGCLLSRMSGSGATCFGLFSSDRSASIAARLLCAAHPNWWVTQTTLA